jgi:hypothetical protein
LKKIVILTDAARGSGFDRARYGPYDESAKSITTESTEITEEEKRNYSVILSALCGKDLSRCASPI